MTRPVIDAALEEQARRWRDEDPDPRTQAEVDALLAAQDRAGLHERFAHRLQFGTAGLRGPLGAGPNRMNRALVRRATAGVAAWLRTEGRTGPVVVGRDARHGSAEFAEDVAAVFAGAGFRVLVLPPPSPTPLLAFAVPHLGAVAGVMITASHNPPADNGYKLYLGDGAQIVPPADAAISACIDAVGSLATVPLSSEGIETVGDDVLEAYLDGASRLIDASGLPLVRTVYTAMHGVGAITLRAAFERCGFEAPHDVIEQVDPDPDFPTVAFPNPEEPGALDLALALATEVHADLVIANDPDADRLAVAVPSGGDGWRALTGDEVGALLADHLLRRGAPPVDAVVVTTVVSSRLLAQLAQAARVSYVEALTGFKWVVRAPAPGQTLLFGYEEALGYSVGGLVHDKDGITAALLITELAASLKAGGTTLVDRLNEIFELHGAHVTRQRSIRLNGVDWLERVTVAMAELRARPPDEIAGRAVLGMEDLLPGERLPPSDVLIFTLDDARLVIRPSGTEAKVKCYAECVVPVTSGVDVGHAHAEASRRVDEVLAGSAELLAQLGL